MEGQGQLFDPAKINTSQFSTPEQRAPFQDAASRFMQEQGRGDYKPVPADRQADPQRGTAQYKAYDAAQKAPETPTIRKSYEALRGDTINQYEFMTRPEDKGGMGLNVEVTDNDPYELGWSGGSDKSARQLMEDDIHQNKRLKVMSTKTTGGHAYFSDDENDKFRAVHDVFGHTAVGGSFSRHGEEAAWESHQQMFSPEAREAMTSETRGQNSYLNFGGEGFPDQTQKLVGLPEWAGETGKLPAGSKNTSRAAKRSEQLKLRFR